MFISYFINKDAKRFVRLTVSENCEEKYIFINSSVILRTKNKYNRDAPVLHDEIFYSNVYPTV